MATDAKQSSASNGPNLAGHHEVRKPDPIRLCVFSPPLTVPQLITKTAEYANNPRSYLQDVLGLDVIQQREKLLCIPAEVDRDIYGTGNHKTYFQQHIANLLGKESGLFFITGIQAQLAAIKIHCASAGRQIAAWHVSSHLETAEERAYEELYGLERKLLGRREDENPTVDEIQEVLSLPEAERPAVILIELPNRTLGCKTYSFEDLEKISTACKAAGVKFHCDGARLWEIEPYYQETSGKTFADIARLFDSVYVSFYKALRGIAGAMLVGNEDLIREAKVWQRRAGGNAVSLMYEVIDCQRGYNENVGTFRQKWDKMAEVQNGIMSATETFKGKNGQRIMDFVAQPTTCCQVRTTISGFTAEELTTARDRVEEKINVRVFERINSKLTVDERTKAERNGKTETNGDNDALDDKFRLYEMEWMIGSETAKIDTKVFVEAYVALCEELLAGSKD